MIFEYKCETIQGNFHELVTWLNGDCGLTKNGWELVTAEMIGSYTIAIFKRLKGKL